MIPHSFFSVLFAPSWFGCAVGAGCAASGVLVVESASATGAGLLEEVGSTGWVDGFSVTGCSAVGWVVTGSVTGVVALESCAGVTGVCTFCSFCVSVIINV